MEESIRAQLMWIGVFTGWVGSGQERFCDQLKLKFSGWLYIGTMMINSILSNIFKLGWVVGLCVCVFFIFKYRNLRLYHGLGSSGFLNTQINLGNKIVIENYKV